MYSACSGGLSSLLYKNREPSPYIPASQHPQPPEPDHNVNDLVTALTTQGIKVRDFAYENILPPVTTVPRFSVQVQPRPRTLKRARDMLEGRDNGEESDEEDPNFSRTFYIDSNSNGVSHVYRYRKKSTTLGRTLTEPADEVSQSQGLNTRAQVFTQPSTRGLDSPRPRHNGALCPATPQRYLGKSPMRSLSPIDTIPQSQPSINGESQETEYWIDTPLVTPNGSIQWPVQNTSALPASQLESVLPQLPDVEEAVTLSQLGFSPERSQPQPDFSSPAGSPSCPPRTQHARPQLPPPPEFRAYTRSPAAPSPTRPRPSSGSRSPTRRSTRKRTSPPSVPLHEAPAPRYDLRQRGVKPPPPARATSRTRASSHAADKVRAPPPSKKRKVTPPLPLPVPVPSGRGRRPRADVKLKENR